MALKLSLTSVAVFQFMTPEGAAKLAKIAKVVDKGKGDAVLLAGETVPGIYIIAEGKVGVTPPGTGVALAHLGQGESFGEMSFLEKSKASATIRADVDGTKLVLLAHADLATLVEGDPEIGRALFRGMAVTLSKKLRMTNERLTAELVTGRKLLEQLRSQDPPELGPIDAFVRSMESAVLKSSQG